jgi:uncharacterized membrane protein YciS (DUF1049 family)
MWIIGLLLLAAAIVVGVEIGISNDQQVDIEAFTRVWTSNPAAAFLVGVVTALVGVFGLWLTFVGMRRSRVRRRRRRAEIAERDRLADERRRELEAMGATRRGDRDDRTVAADHGDGNRDRDRVTEPDRDTVDLQDEPEAERHDVLHRSDR